MQQQGCPHLPDDILEWQTPHLAKPLPEDPEEGELDEEAAEARLQEERLAVGEGLVGELALVRSKRERSTEDEAEEAEAPTAKKQKVLC